MSKKNKQSKRQPVPAEGGEAVKDEITAVGLKIIAGGVAIIVLGFVVLSRADAMGGNWAANLSPFLILGGYLVVGLGIFAPEKLSFGDDPVPSPGLSDQE
ncbi:MAG: hypothetical protein HY926_03040 [Elusimicrobia bacterium]|nr:hypothetical protein [Elusimicrobiota bacterium]